MAADIYSDNRFAVGFSALGVSMALMTPVASYFEKQEKRELPQREAIPTKETNEKSSNRELNQKAVA